MGGLLSSKKAPAHDWGFPAAPEPHGGEEAKMAVRRSNELLRESVAVVQEMAEYKGAREVARVALSEATEENEKKAFEALLPCVVVIKRSFDLVSDFEATWSALMEQACALGETGILFANGSLGHSIASLLELMMRFDGARMKMAHLPNDFSFYRRLLQQPKFKQDKRVTVKDDDESVVSMYTADHIPATHMVTRATVKLQDKAPGGLHASEVLAVVANSCLLMATDGPNVNNIPAQKFLCGALAGAIVVYDHISPLGAFHRKGLISMKKATLHLVRKENEGAVTGLVGALRYSTRHFSDDSTPSFYNKVLG